MKDFSKLLSLMYIYLHPCPYNIICVCVSHALYNLLFAWATRLEKCLDVLCGLLDLVHFCPLMEPSVEGSALSHVASIIVKGHTNCLAQAHFMCPCFRWDTL